MAESSRSCNSPTLEVHNLSIAYSSAAGLIRAVRDVSFELGEGETLSLVGETGSGKSSVALAITGFTDGRNQSGEILYRGRPLRSLTNRDWKLIRGREIGIVFQDGRSALNPVLTVMDHLVETIRAHQTISRSEAQSKALEVLHEVGIEAGQEKRYPFELSGGMCQRVGIALALCNTPGLLIADEPTSAIDSAIQAQILDLLRRMRERHNLTLLLISHDLPLISQVSDRVAVMYHGRIVESGPSREILSAPAHPYTRSLVQCQPSFLHHHEKHPLNAISGIVPGAAQEFDGCDFAPRCSLVEEHCHNSVPGFREISGARRVACHKGNVDPL